MDSDFLERTCQVRDNFGDIYGCRDRLRAALMMVDEVGMLGALGEARGMRSRKGMQQYGEVEVRACLEMLRLIEMSRQVTGEEGGGGGGAGRAVEPRGPLLDARLHKCCADVMAARNSDDDDMEPFLRLVVRRACLLSDVGIEEEEAIRYYKWTIALSKGWTEDTKPDTKADGKSPFRPQFFGFSAHRLESNVPFMNKLSNSMEATYSLGAEGTEVCAILTSVLTHSLTHSLTLPLHTITITGAEEPAAT